MNRPHTRVVALVACVVWNARSLERSNRHPISIESASSNASDSRVRHLDNAASASQKLPIIRQRARTNVTNANSQTRTLSFAIDSSARSFDVSQLHAEDAHHMGSQRAFAVAADSAITDEFGADADATAVADELGAVAEEPPHAHQGCADSSSFVDAKALGASWRGTCADWAHYNCTLAAEMWGYTQQQEDDVLKNCPASCGLCDQTSRSDSLTTPPKSIATQPSVGILTALPLRDSFQQSPTMLQKSIAAAEIEVANVSASIVRTSHSAAKMLSDKHLRQWFHSFVDKIGRLHVTHYLQEHVSAIVTKIHGLHTQAPAGASPAAAAGNPPLAPAGSASASAPVTATMATMPGPASPNLSATPAQPGPPSQASSPQQAGGANWLTALIVLVVVGVAIMLFASGTSGGRQGPTMASRAQSVRARARGASPGAPGAQPQSMSENTLLRQIENAIQNSDLEKLEKYLKESKRLGIDLPQSSEEYRERLHDQRADLDFTNQVNERKRVNWSLNAWDKSVGQMAIRTLFECSIGDIFPSEHAQRVFASVAEDTHDHYADHPFVSVPKHEFSRFQDQLMNKCSALAPDGAVRWDMGLPVTTEKYVFGLTFERVNISMANQKFRVFLIRENLLKHVKEKNAMEVHTNSYFQQRWKELQQLHDLYFEEGRADSGQWVETRRERESILISNPKKPLFLTMAGAPDKTRLSEFDT